MGVRTSTSAANLCNQLLSEDYQKHVHDFIDKNLTCLPSYLQEHFKKNAAASAKSAADAIEYELTVLSSAGADGGGATGAIAAASAVAATSADGGGGGEVIEVELTALRRAGADGRGATGASAAASAVAATSADGGGASAAANEADTTSADGDGGGDDDDGAAAAAASAAATTRADGGGGGGASAAAIFSHPYSRGGGASAAATFDEVINEILRQRIRFNGAFLNSKMLKRLQWRRGTKKDLRASDEIRVLACYLVDCCHEIDSPEWDKLQKGVGELGEYIIIHQDSIFPKGITRITTDDVISATSKLQTELQSDNFKAHIKKIITPETHLGRGGTSTLQTKTSIASERSLDDSERLLDAKADEIVRALTRALPTDEELRELQFV